MLAGGPTKPGRRGSHTTVRELQTCTFEAPALQNTTKIQREDLPERERMKVSSSDFGGREKKSIQNFGRSRWIGAWIRRRLSGGEAHGIIEHTTHTNNIAHHIQAHTRLGMHQHVGPRQFVHLEATSTSQQAPPTRHHQQAPPTGTSLTLHHRQLHQAPPSCCASVAVLTKKTHRDKNFPRRIGTKVTCKLLCEGQNENGCSRLTKKNKRLTKKTDPSWDNTKKDSLGQK